MKIGKFIVELATNALNKDQHAEIWPMVEEMHQTNQNSNLVRAGSVMCLDAGDTRLELASTKGMVIVITF